MRRLLIVLSGIWAVCAALPALAKPIFPGDRSIGLEPPPGMVVRDIFQGFLDPAGRATIEIEEGSGAYGRELAARFARSEVRGVALSDPDPLPVAGATASIRRATTERGGRHVGLWLVLLEREGHMALVQATARLDAYPVPLIEAALRSLVFRAPRTIADDIARLDFRVADMAGFRPVATVGASVLVLTEGAHDVVTDFSQPSVKITRRSERLAPDGTSETPARLFRLIGLVEGLENLSVERASIADGVAVTTGTAVNPRDGTRLYLAQVIRFGPDGNLHTVGIVREDARERYAARLERLGRSVELK